MEYLPFLISGLVTGSVYGLAGSGLVLTYKTSGVFNMAHGALATVSAYAFYELDVVHGLPWPAAALICVLVLGPLLGLVLELLARSLAGASLAVTIASTIGVLLIVQAAISLWYDPASVLVVPQFLPHHQFQLDSTPVSYAQVTVVVFVLVMVVGLFVFFRHTRVGLAMRAVVDNGSLLDQAGTSPTRIRRYAWIIGASFASASGVLIAPLLAQLNALNLTFLIVTAFGAAALGGFNSLPLTYGGGLAIGIAQQLCSKFFTTGILSGLPSALPFVVLFVVLLVFPRRRLVEASRVVPRAQLGRVPRPVQLAGAAAVLLLLVFVPHLDPLGVTDWTNGLAYVILFLSLGLLVRTSGQVSLAHVSFMAIGVSAMSHLTVNHHLPWAVALLLSGLIAVPVGAVLAIPAIRLSGLYLALATLGFGTLLQYMFYTDDLMFGSTGLGLKLPRPQLSWLTIDTDDGYYYLVLGLTIVVIIGIVAITHSRLGRLLRALADSSVGLATSGTSVNVTRVLVFCVSAFLAAIAGAVQGVSAQQVTGDAYNPLQSLIFFAIVMISIGREPWYALFAAFGLILIPTFDVFSGPDTSNWLELLFGIGAVLYAVGEGPREQFLVGRRRRGRATRSGASADNRDPGTVGATMPGTPPSPGAGRAPVAAGTLAVRGVRVLFGGVVAVDGVSLTASTGRITGLIGPNGAGKTTTFNVCSGLLRGSQGQVLLDGHDISRLGPAARTRRGLGRTFQQMELFDSMTVRMNVELGAEAAQAGVNVFSHVLSSRRQARAGAQLATDAMALCGIVALADRTAGTLSTGERRLVELARCLAGDARILLLDEPSSGLDRVETARFGEILRAAVARRGIGILLVEHDMSLVAAVCDDVHVLDFGKPIFTGTTAEALSSPLVRAAYLGDDVLTERMSEPADGAGARR